MAVTFNEQSILLVEDEDFSRSIVSQMLRRIGFGTVYVATGGPEAIEMLAKHRITAVLTDFRMPGMHGLQLLKAIRTGRTAASRDLPCAMLTSYAERHLVGMAIVLDVDTFLAKPVSVDVLTKHLSRVFQYRFEPQAVAMYNAVDVDNVAPHLTGVMAPTRREPDVMEEELKPLPLDEFDTLEPVRPLPSAATTPLPPPAVDRAAEKASGKAPETASRKGPEKLPSYTRPAAAPPASPGASRGAKSATPASTAQPVAPLTGKTIQVALADVPEDAVLAKDLIGTGGTLLLSAGTPFKRRYVKRLEELNAIKETVDQVWIIEPPSKT